jgi:hypothetical protein
MEKIKKVFPVFFISCVFIITFNIISFIIAEEHSSNFWCGYIFITLAWVCLVAIEFMTLSKDDRGKSLFLNAPGILVSIGHLIIQTVLGILLMMISFFNVKITICFEIFIFAIYITLIGMLEIYKSKNQ